MGLQRFYADPKRKSTWPNGAVGYGSGSMADCLGPYAKVENCPIEYGSPAQLTTLRRTCYATGYADSFFSVPAVCKIKGKRIPGYFSGRDDGVVFHALANLDCYVPGAKTYTFRDSPVTCPTCGARADWEDYDSTATCINRDCGRAFLFELL